MTWPRPKIVAGAGLVAVGLLAVVITARDEQSNAVVSSSSRRSRPEASSDDIPVTDLKLESLNAQHRSPAEPERNPFRFEARQTPSAKPAGSSGGSPRPVPTPAPPPQVVPTGPPAPPPIQLRFIGLVEAPSQAGRVAILSDGRGNVFYGKEGDIIEGRYRLLKVGTDSVEMSSLDGSGRQTIRLSGQ